MSEEYKEKLEGIINELKNSNRQYECSRKFLSLIGDDILSEKQLKDKLMSKENITDERFLVEVLSVFYASIILVSEIECLQSIKEFEKKYYTKSSNYILAEDVEFLWLSQQNSIDFYKDLLYISERGDDDVNVVIKTALNKIDGIKSYDMEALCLALKNKDYQNFLGVFDDAQYSISTASKFACFCAVNLFVASGEFVDYLSFTSEESINTVSLFVEDTPTVIPKFSFEDLSLEQIKKCIKESKLVLAHYKERIDSFKRDKKNKYFVSKINFDCEKYLTDIQEIERGSIDEKDFFSKMLILYKNRLPIKIGVITDEMDYQEQKRSLHKMLNLYWKE